MADVLIFGDDRSSALRNEVPVAMPDPIGYVEREGARTVLAGSLDVPRFKALGSLEVISFEELGLNELLAAGSSLPEAFRELVLRACRRLGVTDAVVPADFPARARRPPPRERRVAQSRRRGVRPHAGARRAPPSSTACGGPRRRPSSPWHTSGAGSATAVSSRPRSCGPRRAGSLSRTEPFRTTCSSSRRGHTAPIHTTREPARCRRAFRSSSTSSRATRRPAAGGTSPGRSASAIRRRSSSAGTTSSVEAQQAATEAVRPGISAGEPYARSCDVLEEAGYATRRTAPSDQILEEGFIHYLGHGVGLELHEAPTLDDGGETLVVGDVITIEPGLYRPGFGGCRIEDVVVVTETGYELLTDFPYELRV